MRVGQTARYTATPPSSLWSWSREVIRTKPTVCDMSSTWLAWSSSGSIEVLSLTVNKTCYSLWSMYEQARCVASIAWYLVSLRHNSNNSNIIVVDLAQWSFWLTKRMYRSITSFYLHRDLRTLNCKEYEYNLQLLYPSCWLYCTQSLAYNHDCIISITCDSRSPLSPGSRAMLVTVTSYYRAR